MDLSKGRYWTGLLIAYILYVIVAGPFHRSIARREVRQWDFKGVVQDVRYDIKGIPYVVVNGREYQLYEVIWRREFIINKGDTLIKTKGDLRIKLIRPPSTDTICFSEKDM